MYACMYTCVSMFLTGIGIQYTSDDIDGGPHRRYSRDRRDLTEAFSSPRQPLSPTNYNPQSPVSPISSSYSSEGDRHHYPPQVFHEHYWSRCHCFGDVVVCNVWNIWGTCTMYILNSCASWRYMYYKHWVPFLPVIEPFLPIIFLSSFYFQLNVL